MSVVQTVTCNKVYFRLGLEWIIISHKTILIKNLSRLVHKMAVDWCQQLWQILTDFDNFCTILISNEFAYLLF